jgi:hypothetical protein
MTFTTMSEYVNNVTVGDVLYTTKQLTETMRGLFGKETWLIAAGGVSVAVINLPVERYEEVKAKLTVLFGEPAVWDTNDIEQYHTKGFPPLRFTVKGAPKSYGDHVNLIRTMQQKKKQKMLISWM